MPHVELLEPRHDRRGFDCGKPSLNEFLQQRARPNADRDVGVTHVVVEAPGGARIMGYYTLVARTVERAIIPAKGLPPGPIGVVLLGRLAVDQAFQGKGLGKRMLLRALRQTEEAARSIGIYALVLDALDEAARSWYLGLGWGFEVLLDDLNHLFLPVSTIRALGLTGDGPASVPAAQNDV
ncbi:MAG: GNAT family N-acetyltransferase [Chloroflexi bacterium]|nr:GNAT family N-acetyltransferase [Chloroflexota bacterium]